MKDKDMEERKTRIWIGILWIMGLWDRDIMDYRIWIGIIG
jgi:hypothetical protein